MNYYIIIIIIIIITALSILNGHKSFFVASHLIAEVNEYFKIQVIQDKSKPTRVAMIWLRIKVNRTRLK